MYSMARPSRLVRESATTIRYCGLRILPIRRSRIFTATVCSLLNHLVAILARHRGVGADGARVDWRRARVRGIRTQVAPGAVERELARLGQFDQPLPLGPDLRCLLGGPVQRVPGAGDELVLILPAPGRVRLDPQVQRLVGGV